ncbi:potassium channel family protein [Nisaea nitritireducens]|uniref:potassium channel family protein n=1 Tax=Nisaea nitritireducens TaxID=568392 RepID=UPI0018672540|nr:potassium channel family protein [Nisaea nitritireducens]
MLFLELAVATAAVAVAILVQLAATLVLAYRVRQVLPVWTKHHPAPKVLARVALTAFALLFLGHIVQIWLWAGLYIVLGEFTDLETALYFSTVTISTLGYGDIVLSQDWRLLGAIEAASGILLFGWTTAMLVAVLMRAWQDAQSTAPSSKT